MTDFNSIPVRINGTRFDASWWNIIRDALISSGTVPTIQNYASDAAYETAKGSVGTEGDFYYNTTDDFLKFHNGTAWVTVADAETAQTFTNKVIDGSTNTISNLTHGDQVDNPASGVHGVTGNIVGDADIQVITNKDVDGLVATDTSRVTLPKAGTTALNALADKEATIAYDTDKATLVVNDGATWNEISGAGGGGGINYITNPNAEDDTTGWSVTGTIPLSRETTTPVFDLASFKLTSAGTDYQGDYVSSNFTIDNAGKYNIISGEFWYRNVDLSSGDLQVRIYDVTNAAYISVSNNEIGASLAGDTAHKFSFQASDSVSYRFEIYIASAALPAFDFIYDNVIVKPQEASVTGAPVTDWESYTPALTSFGAVTGKHAYQRRVGDTLELKIEFYSGTHLGSEARFELPSGLVTGSSLELNNVVGQLSTSYASAVNFHILATEGISYLTMGRDDVATSGLASINANSIGNNEFISMYAKVPIAGWSSNMQLSSTTMNREIIAKGAGNSGLSVDANVDDIDWTEVLDSTNSWSGKIFTAPEDGEYVVSGNVLFSAVSVSSIRAYIGGVAGKYVNVSIANTPTKAIAGSITLKKGEELSFRPNVTGTLLNTPDIHYISIQKTNHGTQTIAQDAKVYVEYENNNNDVITANITKIPFITKIKDTHNAWTGEYFTAPRAGEYIFSGSLYSSSTLMSLDTFVNNAKVRRASDYITTIIRTFSVILSLEEGDVVYFRTNASTTLASATYLNFINIRSL